MSAPERDLIDAVRKYFSATAGQGVRRMCFTLEDGRKWKLDVPPAAAVVWPPKAGWAYRGDEFARDGAVFRLAGKSGKVLRALVDAEGEWVTAAVLKKLVWDEFTDDRTVQNAMSRVRAAVRGACPDAGEDDPIEAGEAGYRLVSG